MAIIPLTAVLWKRRRGVARRVDELNDLGNVDALGFLAHLNECHAQVKEPLGAQSKRRRPLDVEAVGRPDPSCDVCVAVRERNRQRLMERVRPYPHVHDDLVECKGGDLCTYRDVTAENWPLQIKRYLMANFEIHVHLWFTGGRGELPDYCAFFVRAESGPEWGAAGPDMAWQSSQPRAGCVGGQVERTVFVPLLQAVEDGQGILAGRRLCVRSIERLQSGDECLRVRSDRANPALISNDEAQRRRGRYAPPCPEDVLRAVRIELAGDEIRFWLDEPINLLLESVEVCTRTREFQDIEKG